MMTMLRVCRGVCELTLFDCSRLAAGGDGDMDIYIYIISSSSSSSAHP